MIRIVENFAMLVSRHSAHCCEWYTVAIREGPSILVNVELKKADDRKKATE